MSRTASLGVLLALLGAVFFLPRPDPIRLAAVQAGSLLLEPTREGSVAEALSEDPPVDATPFWRTLTESSAGHWDEDGNLELWVQGGRMDLSRTSYRDQRLHARLLESVARSLRSIGAEHGFEVNIKQKATASFPGLALICSPRDGELQLEAMLPDGSTVHARRSWIAAGPISVAPSLLAILIAMLFRRPLIALAIGAVTGAMLERSIQGLTWFDSILHGAPRVVTTYLGGELLEPTRQQILIFIVLMLGMVGVISRSGGVRGLMEKLGRVAHGSRRSQGVTYFMGLLIFFDHYANAVLVGTTMRPLTDRFKVAREKLAYLVDSTAAPVAGLSIFSTWIAFEVSTFSVQLPEAGLAASQGYEVFLRTLPFRFYSIFTLFFVGLVVFTGRDFGPMLRAERRARAGQVLRKGARLLTSTGTSDLQPFDDITPRASRAVIPLLTFVTATVAAILIQGGAFGSVSAGELLTIEGLSTVLFAGSGAAPLMYGAALGLFVACLQGLGAGLGSRVASSAWAGVRSAGSALALLCLAWMIGAVSRDLGTAAYLSVILQDALNPLLLPIILFLLSGTIAFATGSSWSTMTILLPLVVGLAFELGESTPIGGVGMLVVSIAAVLEGAIFGDHCSPISDTTVMSSIAASSDHVDHVRTQAPYAVLVMTVALLLGFYPVVIAGLSPWLSLAAGAVVLTGFLLLYGKKSGVAAAEEVEASTDAEIRSAA